MSELDYPFCNECEYEDYNIHEPPCQECHNKFLETHKKPKFKAKPKENCGGNDMENYASTTTPLSGSYTYNTCSCAHRLPCGYCPLLNRVCPMQGVTINPYWTEVTCNGNSTGDAK